MKEKKEKLQGQIFVLCVKAVEKIGRVAFFNFQSVVILSPEWILVELFFFLHSDFNNFFIDPLFRQPDAVKMKKKLGSNFLEMIMKVLPKSCADQKGDQIGNQDCQEDFFAGHEGSLFVVVRRQCWIFWVIWTTNFTRRRGFSTSDCSKCPFSENNK